MGLKDRLRNLEKKLSGDSSEEIILVECDAGNKNFEIHCEGEIVTFPDLEGVEEYIEKLQKQTGKKYRTILICKVYPDSTSPH